MGLESAAVISELVPANPLSGDPIAQGDDHIRLIKAVLQGTFPNADDTLRFQRENTVSVNTTLTLDNSQELVGVDATGGVRTITLPVGGTLKDGTRFKIVKLDSSNNAVVIAIQGGDTINGTASYTLARQYEGVTVEWINSGFVILAARPLTVDVVSASKTLDNTDEGRIIAADNSVGNITITLPAAPILGYKVTVFKADTATGLITLDGNGADTINGRQTFVLQFVAESVTLQYVGVNSWLASKDYRDFGVGAVIPWMLPTVPAYALALEGGTFNKADYPRLDELLSADSYPYGSAAGTFNLPDTRGEFIRGFDNTAGNDPDAGSRTDRGDGTTGDAVGTKQADEFEAHTHDMGGTTSTDGTGGADCPQVDSGSGELTASTGGNETRPRNIGFRFIVRV